MKIENEFGVDVPVERAWEALTDLESLAPCMPGAQLTGVEDDVYKGRVKVKVGPVISQFAGTARFEEKDDAAHRAVIRAAGKDARGGGNASARIHARLHPEGTGTRVHVDTDLTISGRLAQFGSGMIKEISEKLLAQFVQNLEAQLHASPPPADGKPAPGVPASAEGKPAPGVPASGEGGAPGAPASAPAEEGAPGASGGAPSAEAAPSSAPAPAEGKPAPGVPASAEGGAPGARGDAAGSAPGASDSGGRGAAAGEASPPGQAAPATEGTDSPAPSAPSESPATGAPASGTAPAGTPAAEAPAGSAGETRSVGSAATESPEGVDKATSADEGSRASEEPEALDLMSLAGSSVYKRLIPVVVVALIVIGVVVWLIVR
ncbi:MAG: SRPBCC domain-containing protein [Actinomycetia bacterium]|nr:SRPBCC domain-containing protein [Actinomycetes bacterium]